MKELAGFFLTLVFECKPGLSNSFWFGGAVGRSATACWHISYGHFLILLLQGHSENSYFKAPPN